MGGEEDKNKEGQGEGWGRKGDTSTQVEVHAENGGRRSSQT